MAKCYQGSIHTQAGVSSRIRNQHTIIHLSLPLHIRNAYRGPISLLHGTTSEIVCLVSHTLTLIANHFSRALQFDTGSAEGFGDTLY
jgi:hypothetical protein